MTSQKIKIFQKKIRDFYAKNKREFPWRETTDPYRILVSEVMLQQTQTSRVISKYQEFLERFPKIGDLAKATNTEVLQVWSGLGYNRRGLYLKRISEKVFKDFQEKIPLDPKVLITFPGIGPNTAGSIYVFSTNLPHTFIETNIRRVFIYEFFKDKANIYDKEILKLVEKTLDIKNPRKWYYALMDYGVYLSKIEINPNRKSKHYTKQSKFEGSARQIRGKILKTLIQEKTIRLEALKEKASSPHFDAALSQLEKEQFILIKNKQVILR